MVLRVMKEIEAVVKFNSKHPYPELNWRKCLIESYKYPNT